MNVDSTLQSAALLTTVALGLGSALAILLSRQRKAYEETLEKRLGQVESERDDLLRKVANLEGQLFAMTSDFLEKLGERITRAAVDALRQSRPPRRGDDPGEQDWR